MTCLGGFNAGPLLFPDAVMVVFGPALPPFPKPFVAEAEKKNVSCPYLGTPSLPPSPLFLLTTVCPPLVQLSTLSFVSSRAQGEAASRHRRSHWLALSGCFSIKLWLLQPRTCENACKPVRHSCVALPYYVVFVSSVFATWLLCLLRTPCSPWVELDSFAHIAVPTYAGVHARHRVGCKLHQLTHETFLAPCCVPCQRDPNTQRSTAVLGGEGRPCCPRSHAGGRG